MFCLGKLKMRDPVLDVGVPIKLLGGSFIVVEWRSRRKSLVCLAMKV